MAPSSRRVLAGHGMSKKPARLPSHVGDTPLAGRTRGLSAMSRIRRIALGLWVVLVVTLTALYAMSPELLRPETLVDALRRSGQPVLAAYVLLCVVRAFTLIPSTVLIIVGALLFPDRPWFVMVSSLGGVVVSAALVYFFFDFLGIGDLFERRHARRVRWLEEQMNTRGFWLVLAWSAFPFVPTDMICYVAGTLRMHFGTFTAGVALGELPVVGFYVLAGGLLFGG